jgi:integrase
MRDSTTPGSKRKATKAATGKPPKPYPDYPLCPHASGAWQKKIRGKVHYFGKWGRTVSGKLERLPGDGWKEALDQYNEQRDDLYAGRTPRVKGEGLTIDDLRGRFLTAKSRALDAGEITKRTYAEYRATADRLISIFGEKRLVDDLAADDFELLRAEIAKTWGPIRLGNEIQRVRTIFKYGYEAGLIENPVRYGPQFKKPAKAILRKHRAANGSRMFKAEEIRAILDKAGVQMRAMILLGINCGFGNSDCGSLPLEAVDLEGGWITFPRPKTGIGRRCPLWPETVEALKAAIATRPKAKLEEHQKLVFITKYNEPWAKDVADSPVTKQTRKLLDDLKLYRPGLGFYALRHSFRTVADATRDLPAVRLIMGHADGSIDDVYREHIDDSRLRTVVDHVHNWLWPVVKSEEAGQPKAKPKTKRPRVSKPKANLPTKQPEAKGQAFALRIVG